jgi:hypothetical protein
MGVSSKLHAFSAIRHPIWFVFGLAKHRHDA